MDIIEQKLSDNRLEMSVDEDNRIFIRNTETDSDFEIILVEEEIQIRSVIISNIDQIPKPELDCILRLLMTLHDRFILCRTAINDFHQIVILFDSYGFKNSDFNVNVIIFQLQFLADVSQSLIKVTQRDGRIPSEREIDAVFADLN